MDEAGDPFLCGEDSESYIGGGDILERAELFYGAGTSHTKSDSLSRTVCRGEGR